MRINGEQFWCEKHGLDYRLLCEECREKQKKFSKVARGMILKNRSIRISYET